MICRVPLCRQLCVSTSTCSIHPNCAVQTDTLTNFPFPIGRVACRNCRRRGRYQLARLVARFVADAKLGDILMTFSADCALSANEATVLAVVALACVSYGSTDDTP